MVTKGFERFLRTFTGYRLTPDFLEQYEYMRYSFTIDKLPLKAKEQLLRISDVVDEYNVFNSDDMDLSKYTIRLFVYFGLIRYLTTTAHKLYILNPILFPAEKQSKAVLIFSNPIKAYVKDSRRAGYTRSGKDVIFYNVDDFRRYFGKDTPMLLDNWRDGKRGDWVKADDGCVLQIKKEVKFGRLRFKKTTLGYYHISDEQIMDGRIEFHSHYNMLNFINPTKVRFFGSEKKEPIWIDRFIQLYMKSGNFSATAKQIRLEFGLSKGFYKTAKNNLSLRRRLKMVFEEERKKLGLDESWVLERMMDLAQTAKVDLVKLNTLKEIATLLDMYPKETPMALPQGGWSRELPETQDAELEDDVLSLPDEV